jgi:hypothetical protein
MVSHAREDASTVEVVMKSESFIAWAAGCVALGLVTASGAAVAADGTRDGSASCEAAVGSGYAPWVGEVKFHYEIKGNVARVTTTQYRMYSPHVSGRNKGNVNSDLRVWNNVDGSGAGTPFKAVESPDAMIQDGQWHTLNQTVGGDVGFAPRQLRAAVKFIFDNDMADPSCWAEQVQTF